MRNCIVLVFIINLYSIVTSQSNVGDDLYIEHPTLKIFRELPLTLKFYSDETLSLQCNIRGSSYTRFQWYMMKSGNSEIDYEKVPNGNSYILEIDGSTYKERYFKRIYFCSARNELGTLYSNKITVEMISKPVMVSIVYNRHEVYQGEKYVVECSLNPDLLSSVYKFISWEVQLKSGEIINLKKTEKRFSIISVMQNPQLHIRNVTADDFLYTKVRCVFRNKISSINDNMQNSFQNIVKFIYQAPSDLSKVVCSGRTINVYHGSTVELPWCSVPETLEPTWYWSPLDNTNTEIPIKHKDKKFSMISERYGNLKIENIKKEDAGYYKVMAKSNKAKQTTFIINVYEQIKLNLTPKSVNTPMNEPVTFSCTTNYQFIKISWIQNGKIITAGYDDNNVEIKNTKSTSNLLIKSTRLSSSGIYQCIVVIFNEIEGINEYRQAYSYIRISNFPPIVIKQSPKVEFKTNIAHMQIFSSNRIKTIDCVFAAHPTPSIQWYLNGQKIPINKYITPSLRNDSESLYNVISKNDINLYEIRDISERKTYAGEYKAVATNHYGSKSCTFFVFIESELELRLPTMQTAVMGQDFIFSCFFVAMGLPKFSWEKYHKNGYWESLPISMRTNLMNQSYNLLIQKVIKGEDEGIYRCKANYGLKEAIQETRLLVAKPPYVVPIDKIRLDKNNVQILMCRVSNDPDKPWYAWWTFRSYKDNVTHILKPKIHGDKFKKFNITYDSSNTIINQRSFNQTVKSIPSFLYDYPNQEANLKLYRRAYDNYEVGVFTCIVKNHIGYDQTIIKDDTFRLDFAIIPRSVTVVLGDTVYIDCTAKEGGHNPSIKWRKHEGDSYININDLRDKYDGRIFQYRNGTLVLRNIQETDPSKLYCFIISSIKTVEAKSRVSYINIKIPSKIIKSMKNIERVRDTSFNLSCKVYGHADQLMVNWFYRSNVIDPWKKMSRRCIYSQDNKCPVQSVEEEMREDHYDIPNVFSTKVLKHNRTFHSINLEIKNASEQFAGEYKCESRNKFNLKSDNLLLNLTIISEPSSVNFIENTDVITSNRIGFKWEPPLKNGNKPLTSYVIKYFENIQTDIVDNKTESQNIIVNSSITSYVINNLKPNRIYEVQIFAVNQVGKSKPKSINLKTLEAKPDHGVINLKASSSKPNEIFISWDPPDIQYQNGEIQHYQICFQKILPQENVDLVSVSSLNWPSENDIISNNGIVCQDTKKSSIYISNRLEFTDYGIRVVAYNRKGASPPSYTKVRTLEDLPQSPPTSLICESKQQSINLNWNPPTRQSLNGILIGYLVQYYEPNDFGDESDMKSINVQGTTKVEITQLKPNTKYLIKVMAINRKGLGPPSSNLVCATNQAPPEKPDQMKTVRVNNSCVYVSWLHTKVPNGEIVEYCCVALSYPNNYPNNRKCQPPDFTRRYNTMMLCNPNGITQLKVFARNMYDGSALEEFQIYEYSSILSIGGTINVEAKKSLLLPCETIQSKKPRITWRHDDIEIFNQDISNYKIYANNSLFIKSVDKYGPTKFSCDADFDSIHYAINIHDSPNGLPRSPYISDSRVTENSVFISWKSRGTTDIESPITNFLLTWENLYQKNQQNVILDKNVRTFYLNNVTCASDFIIKIKAENKNGKSDFSNIKRIRTLGDIPQIPDTNVLLPIKNIHANTAYFNMKSFGPGNNCSANRFIVEITLSYNGALNFENRIVFRNLSIYELEDRCCFRAVSLNPSTIYTFRITALNPAGSNTAHGSFKTKTIGTVPRGRSQSEKQPENNILQITLGIFLVFIVLILVVITAVILYNKRGKKNQSKTRTNQRNQEFIKKPKNDQDNISSDSEPSPYAIYQPEMDLKNSMISSQISKSNYYSSQHPENTYNHVNYNQYKAELFGQNMALRRSNSADCLSSNASVSGIGELESRANVEAIPPNSRNHYTDDIFNQQYNQQRQFATLGSRKNLPRDSLDTRDHYAAHSKNIKLPSRIEPPQLHSDYYKYPDIQSRPHMIHPQMSMPEGQMRSNYQVNPSLYKSRQRADSSTGLLNKSQAPLISSSMQGSQYNSYYGSQNQPFNSNNYTSRKSLAPNNYGSRPVGNNSTNRIIDNRSMHYGPIPVAAPGQLSRQNSRPNENIPSNQVESPDESIYTDRIVLV